MQMKLLSFLTVTAICLFRQFPSCSARDLVFVQAIWRHGARSPLSLPYPNDPYNETVWPRGWKRLTNIGIGQMYELGMYFRQTYYYFVSSNADPKEVYIRSSDEDRALTSAQAFLFGFYPNKSDFQWQERKFWPLLPIHSTSPGEPDLLLKPSPKMCKKVNDLVKNETDEQAKYYNARFADFFKIIGEQSGIKNFSYVNMDRIFDIQDEIDNYLIDQQPQWINRRWPQYDDHTTMDIINKLHRVHVLTRFNGTAKYILMGGYLLNDWVNNVVKVVNGSMMTSKKMLLYSSHEGTLLSLMYSLGVANDLRIPYASSLIMEISKDKDNYYIELQLRNDTRRPPYLLEIDGCPNPCSVKTFFSKYSNMVITSYRQQQALCGTPIDICNGSSVNYYYFVVTLLIILFNIELKKD